VPQFDPGEEGVAIATFPTKPAGLECTAELWLASDMTKVATSGEIPFTATGGDKSISLSITLPGDEGTYPVYLDVFSNGQRIARFLGDEDVVIVAPAVPWAFSSVQCWHSASGVGMWRQSNFACTVTNIGSASATKTLTLWCRDYLQIWNEPPGEWGYWTREWSNWRIVETRTITLAAGASYQYNQATSTLIPYVQAREQYLADSDGYESLHCTIPDIPY